MPFRTGSQASIGNGSTLVLLGTHPMREEISQEFYKNSSGTWVELIAHIEAEKSPPDMDPAILSQKHARALWKYQCETWYNRSHARILTHPTKKWVRLAYLGNIEGCLRDPYGYLFSEASKNENVWKMIKYACFGGASANRVIGPGNTFGHLSDYLPIQTSDLVRQLQGNYEGLLRTEKLLLGFEGVAERVAECIASCCIWRQLWGDFRKGYIDNLADIQHEAFREGLAELVRDGFIHQQEDSEYDFEIRESFVVRCWERAVAL